jgi:hypothetical protein
MSDTPGRLHQLEIERDEAVESLRITTGDALFWLQERNEWREVARRFHRAVGPNGCCIDMPALRGAIAEFERLKEGAQ